MAWPGSSLDTSLPRSWARKALVSLQNACGKTTLAKCMTQTIAPASGTVSCPVAQPAAASGAADEAWIMRAAVTVVLPIAAAAAAAEFAPRVLQAYPSLFAQLGQQSGLGKKAIEQALAPAAACCAALMVLVVLMLVRLVLLRRASGVAQKAWDDVVTFATSEDSPGTKMPQVSSYPRHNARPIG